MATIDPTSYRAEVSTAVEDDYYFDEDDATKNRAATVVEILAHISQDAIAAQNKELTLLAWAQVADCLPPFMQLKEQSIAEFSGATDPEVQLEVQRITNNGVVCPDATNQADQGVITLLRSVLENVFEKRNKILRLLSWLYVLSALPSEMAILERMAKYCGLTRQACNKDIVEIKQLFPELGINNLTKDRHRLSNKSNIKLNQETKN